MRGFVPATVTTSGNFIQYIRMIGEFHTEIYENFNFHYRHREIRMRYFGAHRSALKMSVNLLIGVDEQNDLCISYSHNFRLNSLPFSDIQKKNVKIIDEQFVENDDDNLDMCHPYRPLLLMVTVGLDQTFRAVLARRTLVILTNESYTSIMCSVCHNRTVSLVHQIEICGYVQTIENKKNKKNYYTGNNRKGRKILWWCDEENNPLTRTSHCPDRVRAGLYRFQLDDF
ncbi:hypothetical protein INT45_013673 [Circinella minor]|uniref:Uncharacterized protein n=1 Tax=Circinella minor TaxID=1195481 RepID=A0A8H7VNK5_9FUNG|nr:hypothetical protein INT45_013673 [Circinella minor]